MKLQKEGKLQTGTTLVSAKDNYALMKDINFQQLQIRTTSGRAADPYTQ
jgi:hypothetical protein